MTVPDEHPVIVGVGQHTWREVDTARSPVDALAEACASALADTGSASVAQAVDALAVVRFIADTTPGAGALFPRDPGALVADRLGLGDAQRYLGAIGGNSPQYLVNRFAQMLSAGEHSVVLLTGAELMATFFSALRSGGDLSAWAGEPAQEPPTLGEQRDGLNESEQRHGLYEPINTYPLFENSLRHHLGHGLQEHSAHIAEISSRMSAVAARNPLAWRPQARSAQDIGTVARNNRYIGFPYTRAMNAVLEVDMAAAVVLTTAGRARALGIDQARWIYLRGGADVNDIWYPSERDNLHSSPAIGLAWRALSAAAGLDLDDLTHFDIYSCFPSAVQVACREIGLSPLDSREVTVTGGLPYFGGPGNNYSLHAIAQMVERLRGAGHGNGLVTANGYYLTKHSLGLYSTAPGAALPQSPDSRALQAQVDAGPRVNLAADASGEVTVETYTVGFDREGPKQGIFVARNAAGERVLANAPPGSAALQQLVDHDPIGQRGRVRVDGDRNVLEL
ncbi:MAG: acetyl-CoA acetyltransferase [Halioglobus sp.]|nr:acetyl-CoA acetyltransferase [Halioglobus sp.]|tara:strand:+ start:1569 stop:3089 length:1521 start_codon:yes stop_codon:yes gene_type:complete